MPGASVAKIGSRCLHHLRLAADHHAVAALQAPDAAAGADVHVVNPFGTPAPWRGGCRRCSRNCRRRSGCRPARAAAAGRRWSCPRPPPAPSARRRAASRSFFTKSASEAAPTAFSLTSSFDRFGRHVEDHALVAVLDQPPHHVGAHPAQSDHSELHTGSFVTVNCRCSADTPARGARLLPAQEAVARDQCIRGAVVSQLGFSQALELGNDSLGQHLAQLHAPLVE